MSSNNNNSEKKQQQEQMYNTAEKCDKAAMKFTNSLGNRHRINDVNVAKPENKREPGANIF